VHASPALYDISEYDNVHRARENQAGEGTDTETDKERCSFCDVFSQLNSSE
jgi:hypothetical protein